MKKIYLVAVVLILMGTRLSYGQYVFNFSFGPGLSLNRIDPSQLDTFAVSWNDHYKVNLKQGYSNWKSSSAAPGFEIAFDMYNPAKLSGHLFFSIGAYWGKQTNQSILWNNYKHELALKFNDVPVFVGLGLQYKGHIFLDYLIGGNFRTMSLTSTVTYPDGSRSMGYEMDILGYYENSSPKIHNGIGLSLRISRIMLSARWTFPFKSKVFDEGYLMDFDVNRYRQSEFPIDFRVFSDPTQVLVRHEENLMTSNPLHRSVINFSVKLVLGKLK